MKTNFLKLTILTITLPLLIFWGWENYFHNTPNVYAVGDLTVDWGVSSGPIFTISNMSPGQMVSRVVTVTNNASIDKTISIQGTKTSGNGLENALLIEISDGTTTLYGAGGSKTLQQFFNESTGLNSISLSTLSSSQSVDYTIKVTFDPNASNAYQNKFVQFDISIGITFDIPAQCQNLGLTNAIFGTEGNDRLRGTGANDLIVGFGGNDQLDGNSGNDCVIGGDGNDRLRGGSGSDVIFGGEGNDNIDAGSDNDLVLGQAGNDNIDDSSGADQISGGPGNDSLDGGSGNDQVAGDGGNDTLRGGSGNDSLNGGDDTDNLHGGSGTDTCVGEVKHTCET